MTKTRCVRFLKLKLLAARGSAKYMDRSKGQYSDRLIKYVQAELHDAEIRERAAPKKTKNQNVSLKKPGLESYMYPLTFRDTNTKIKTEESRIKTEKESIKTEKESKVKTEKESKVKTEKESKVKTEKESKVKTEKESRVKTEKESRVKTEKE
jgi:hypothetical protein